MRPGEIWLVRFPFTDLASAKRRPSLVLHLEPNFLVISRASVRDCLMLAISSVPQNKGSHDIEFPDTDPAFVASGLRTTSLFKIPKLFTLEESLAERRLGHLTPPWFECVRDAVRSCI